MSLSKDSLKKSLSQAFYGMLQTALIVTVLGVAAFWALGFYLLSRSTKSSKSLSPVTPTTQVGAGARLGKMGAVVNLISDGIGEHNSLTSGNRG